MEWINPKKIDWKDLPLIVFSDHSYGLIQWAIKVRTQGNYNHVMIMIEPDYFSSQGLRFERVPIEKYLLKNNRLKFWKIKDLTSEERKTIEQRIIRKLRAPWWKVNYDFLGIIGQAVGVTWLNIPWKQYCSESVINDIKDIVHVPDKHLAPEQLNEIFKIHSRMEVFGRWAAD